MTAKEMFEALGWVLGEMKDEYRDDIVYYQKKQGSATYDLDFYFEDKTYYSYGFAKGHNINCPLNVDEHKAITQQMKELGWIE
jgi:hypothetical protein